MTETDCLKGITLEELQPYGKFIPFLPRLEPPHGDEKQWTVIEESWYIANDGTVVHLQVGDKTDLASIPRIGKLIFGGAGRETSIAVVHDEGYRQIDHLRYNVLTKKLWIPSQKWWDQMFRDGALLCKTSKTKTRIIYRMLRMFGWIAWNRYRRKQSAKSTAKSSR